MPATLDADTRAFMAQHGADVNDAEQFRHFFNTLVVNPQLRPSYAGMRGSQLPPVDYSQVREPAGGPVASGMDAAIGRTTDTTGTTPLGGTGTAAVSNVRPDRMPAGASSYGLGGGGQSAAGVTTNAPAAPTGAPAGPTDPRAADVQRGIETPADVFGAGMGLMDDAMTEVFQGGADVYGRAGEELWEMLASAVQPGPELQLANLAAISPQRPEPVAPPSPVPGGDASAFVGRNVSYTPPDLSQYTTNNPQQLPINAPNPPERLPYSGPGPQPMIEQDISPAELFASLGPAVNTAGPSRLPLNLPGDTPPPATASQAPALPPQVDLSAVGGSPQQIPTGPTMAPMQQRYAPGPGLPTAPSQGQQPDQASFLAQMGLAPGGVPAEVITNPQILVDALGRYPYQDQQLILQAMRQYHPQLFEAFVQHMIMNNEPSR